MPDKVVGPAASTIVFQSDERMPDGFTVAGCAEDWRKHVASLASGNPWLVLAASAAFAGPLLKPCGIGGGGVHLVGNSSIGKTTALELAASVWGAPDGFTRSWRATSNGLEGVAALHTDLLLPLDEISECDAREVGAVVYSLANGVGKTRSSRAGNARPPKKWRVFTLSTGERTIAAAMQEGGRRQKAGQTVRLLDLPAARRFGMFDELHGRRDGHALANDIKAAARRCHGAVGRVFVERLTHDEAGVARLLKEAQQEPGFAAEGGQEARAAAQFALLGVAGELATTYGLTGWSEGAALDAAIEAYRAWRDLRGGGDHEAATILNNVADFLDRHGGARFERDRPLDANEKTVPVRDRAGWRLTESDRYAFTPDGLREALGGFDPKVACPVLVACGALDPGSDGRNARPLRLGGERRRVYVIDRERLPGGGADDA